MSPIGTLLLGTFCLMVLWGPRRLAVLGMVAGALYMPETLAIQVAGLNVFAMRFLELAGFVRVLMRREFFSFQRNQLDRTLILLYCYIAIAHGLRTRVGETYVVGKGVDAFLCYFVFRSLIRDSEDWVLFLRDFLILLVPYALLLLVECLTRNNLFAYIAPLTQGGWLRGGRLRCFGGFRQPDLLGALGASFIPIYIGLAYAGINRSRAIIGIGLCIFVVWTTNSGGPAGAAAMALCGWCMWRFRTKMRQMRWALVGLIALLAMVMKAPVWYILARVSSVTGGGGWHRAHLVDVATEHVREWWLAGMPAQDTFGWFPYYLTTTGGSDITNQFLVYGIDAGLGAIAIFILLITRAFGHLGRALIAVRSYQPDNLASECMLWALGVTLTVHIVVWLGVSYFDQFYVIWFMHLAVISSVSESSLASAEASAEAPDNEPVASGGMDENPILSGY